MKNSIMCCISCILPCGALDVIRIVHSNGSVEEISGNIRAGDIMKTYPKHVLRKATSPSNEEMLPKIVVVSPETELQRGKIYFLMRVSSVPDQKNRSKSSTRKNKQKELECNCSTSSDDSTTSMSTKLLSSDHYLNEILSEKVSTQRDRRRGRVGVWRPHLESINELPTDFYE
ncbi:6,7-dimethyl-8-ribityllumazine synthase [Thalictrum thalictroides]|uniref:6,7-dimethyl-8-ribityllumazine synthase n=1 Tax=Thalictrum thalictroides TaxID=46969 RepID=A0A7J6X1K9_THATH|nr:6,7-dimethyl-8-ribityllumazine synthase [Thalictrum thalictroides]